MMGGCRCTYKTCQNTTKTAENIHFFHFPVKHKERCKIWIENADKPHFCHLDEEQLRNKVVCELHFEDKFFPNSQRKRLLQGAIPTLDSGCEPEIIPSLPQTILPELEDVQILPANEDGTIFVLDTESMFNKLTPSQKVESYIYKNGTIVPTQPKHHINNSSDNFLFSTKFPKIELDSCASTKQNVSIFDENSSNENFEHDIDEGPKMFESLERSYHPPAKVQKVQQVPKQVVPEPIPEPEKPKPVEKKSTATQHRSIKPNIERNYLRKIKQHSREIASIKRILKQKNFANRLNKMDMLKNLQDFLPPTLYSIVSLNLSNVSKFSQSDINFFVNIKKTSPEVYRMLTEKYEWNLPDDETLNNFRPEKE